MFIHTGEVELCFPLRDYHWNPYGDSVEDQGLDADSLKQVLNKDERVFSEVEVTCDLLVNSKPESFFSRFKGGSLIDHLGPHNPPTDHLVDETKDDGNDLYYLIDKDIKDGGETIKVQITSTLLRAEECHQFLKSLYSLTMDIVNRSKGNTKKKRVRPLKSFTTCIRI